MKDKTHVTLMVGTSSSGKKVPLAVVGKPKIQNASNWWMTQGHPLPYKKQANSWLDQKFILWCVLNVFWLYPLHTEGGVNETLFLDRCFFLSSDVTNTHQPAYMGMISSIKVGYKVTFLDQLLSIFDIEGGFLRAYVEKKKQNRGCKGTDFGGNPHLLDAMIIMKPLWEEY